MNGSSMKPNFKVVKQIQKYQRSYRTPKGFYSRKDTKEKDVTEMCNQMVREVDDISKAPESRMRCMKFVILTDAPMPLMQVLQVSQLNIPIVS